MKKYYILFLSLMICGCEEQDMAPVVTFSLGNTLLHPYEELIIQNNSDETLSYQWYINNNYFSNLDNIREPKMALYQPGNYTIKLIATSQSGKSSSVEQEFRVGSYQMEKIIIKEIQGLTINIWDADSLGDAQYPDIFLARKINEIIDFQSPVFWNTSNGKLPIEIDVSDTFIYNSQDIDSFQWVFYDMDQEGVSQPMFTWHGLSYSDYEYDAETTEGKFTVYRDWVIYELHYKII